MEGPWKIVFGCRLIWLSLDNEGVDGADENDMKDSARDVSMYEGQWGNL